MIIGLGGKAGSGKSTAAAYLAGKGFKEITFADPLKEGAGILFGFNPEQTHGAFKDRLDHRIGKTPREVLQSLGDFTRVIWPEAFITAVRRQLHRAMGPVVISDVRFLNEARALKLLGAVLIRLERQGPGVPVGCDGHASETELDDWPDWDARIANNGDLTALYQHIDRVLRVFPGVDDPH